MKKQNAAAIAAAVGMLALILDGRTALSGMRDGVDICLRVLIPSLFPFFLLSGILTSSLSGASLPLLRPLGRALGIPAGSEYLLAIGALGGYPVGAQNVAQAYREGQLSQADASRMLAFCSNAGPSFLFGMLAPFFHNSLTPWLLWAVHLGSALLVGLSMPGTPEPAVPSKAAKPQTFPQILEQSLRVMALVCGWVILFRLVLAFLDRWVLWMLPDEISVLLAGLLELSNGCIRLCGISGDGLRFLLAAVMLALGGCCVTLQTVSVIAPLSLRSYFLGKAMQVGYTLLLVLGLEVNWLLLIPAVLLPTTLRRVLKKSGSFLTPVGV